MLRALSSITKYIYVLILIVSIADAVRQEASTEYGLLPIVPDGFGESHNACHLRVDWGDGRQ